MRALLSVYDKAGVVDLARGLVDLGWELVSSGGTARALTEAGLPVTTVEEVTGSPEMLSDRVKTLHPRIHGGLLADLDQPAHRADLEAQGIEPFALLVSNLYPFRSDPSIELIDIGGPAMVRAAAKNHAHVGVVVDPADYDAVLAELREHGRLASATRRRLARDAFAHTAAYDAAIVGWFDDVDRRAASDAGPPELPRTVHLAIERVQDLRYGENPHQQGARYRAVGETSWWDGVEQHSGLALSYLNLFDAAAAWALVHDLGAAPAVAIIKHANPCGVAVADSLADAYQRAFDCDPRSAFGGIVALNRPVDAATADEMVAAAQADVVIAPGWEPGTLDALRAKRRNTRLLTAPPPSGVGLELRQIDGGWLVQDPAHFAATRAEWRVVTKAQPTPEQWADAELAWRVCGHVKSNSIVLVRGGVAWGIGAGQQNRVESGEIAAKKAAGRAAGGAAASDAFYPFPDGIDAAAAAGVGVVIQPGGSVRDDHVIAAADGHGLAMIFTGERHFLH
ncbi:MAG TPA: bifunctional phosphoribosylaminoimidazolecarboxamide formyltransferase/IMP cyclohydrolase [Acidimicrobiales bacterium]|nr:bifunctional phosphoribosylaminoimidazolecarboxamide formyltransferase/IMP cyclohydrolase [Acidimicrobiales bacterium]